MNTRNKWGNIPATIAILVFAFTFFVAIVASVAGSSGQKKGDAATRLPDRPIGTTVVDENDYLSQSTIDTIDRLNESWSKTDNQLQVGVYITKYLPSDDLEDFSNELFRKWKVGYKNTNNGVLLVVDVTGRRFRIETSDRASIEITDSQAKRILDNSRAYFRANDYNGGIINIVNAIGDQFYGTQTASSAPEEDRQEDSQDDTGIPIGLILFLLFMFLTLWFGGGGPGGNWISIDHSGSSFGGGSHHSSGGGFSGGGGWSGGGGGGGGASSGW